MRSVYHFKLLRLVFKAAYQSAVERQVISLRFTGTGPAQP